MSTIPDLSPAAVRLELIARREIALIDLREEAEFARGHPLFASQMPLSRLELEALECLPRRDTLIVLLDNGENLVPRAFRVLRALGYSNVHALEGGLAGWRDAGFELFQDVNSYCKAFGELVEQRRSTPSLPAQQVKDLLESGQDVVVMDARPFDEYRVMSIPSAVNVPGAELVLRARALAPDPNTRIIINCAGRTRSLIGTQSLINAGVPNPVAALRNGTIGWALAGQKLDHGQSRVCGEVSPAILDEARAAARQVAYRAGVRTVNADDLQILAQESRRTLYRFDVRPIEEYSAAHLPCFRHAPGGQLVQETDVFAPVRAARIVLFDDKGVRAYMSGSWLAQLGWDTYVLEGSVDMTARGAWRPQYPDLPLIPQISADALARRLEHSEVSVVDVATSRAHHQGHIPGAWFAIRAQLDEALRRLPKDKPLVFTSPDGALACLAAADTLSLGWGKPVSALAGGTTTWTNAGLPLEAGLLKAASEPTDVYRRPYEGTDNSAAAMQAYLDWEYGLVEQLERDGSHAFYVI